MTTLSSAADVLRCLSADRPHLTVTTTAELLGVPKSTASRLLRAMQEAGFLETVGASKKYRPGLLLYEAGRLYRDSSSLIERAAAVVARISGATGHTGYVSKREGRDIVAVTDHPGDQRAARVEFHRPPARGLRQRHGPHVARADVR